MGRTLTLVVAGALLAGCGGPTPPPTPTTSPAALFASPASPSASTNGLLPVPTSLPAPSLTPTPSPTPTGPFPGGLLIADRGNGRLIVVDNAGRIVWRFPVTGSLPAGQAFSADDAFVSPDGLTITANDEDLEVIVRIDIATRRVIWEYGHYGLAGSAPGRIDPVHREDHPLRHPAAPKNSPQRPDRGRHRGRPAPGAGCARSAGRSGTWRANGRQLASSRV